MQKLHLYIMNIFIQAKLQPGVFTAGGLTEWSSNVLALSMYNTCTRKGIVAFLQVFSDGIKGLLCKFSRTASNVQNVQMYQLHKKMVAFL